MIKVVRFVKRRKDLTREQFKEYWLKQHSKLETLPQASPVKKIVATFFTDKSLPPGIEPPFDGIAELYYETIEDVKRPSAERVKQMRADESNFVDLSDEPGEELLRFVTEEHVILDRTK
ncbi:MAG: EthD domain-containing protein [Nitrososphaerales archaeon]